MFPITHYTNGTKLSQINNNKIFVNLSDSMKGVVFLLKEIYPSSLKLIDFDNSMEWLPFHGLNSQAITAFCSSIIQLKENESYFGWYEKKQLLFVVGVSYSKEEVYVHHLLKVNQEAKISDLYQGLIEIGKRRFLKRLILKIKKMPSFLEDEFHKVGLYYQEKKGYVKEFEYNTGLVLGGGGAKGAYQIGVWHCLEEKKIPFKMISGTSVGALNGALILQGDLETAEKMWQTMTTDDIISFSPEDEKEYSMQNLVLNIQKLAKTAIQSKGVSTEPLLNLIKEIMIPDVIFNQDIEFFAVTTELPKMKEKVVSLKEMTEESFPKWLVASSSFFPAMAPTHIDDVYYVDGGYRNNIPRDVLLSRGATELLVIDVHGLGIKKSYQLDEGVVEIVFNSSWGLGNVLLFDGGRSAWNMRLGYLEAKKIMGDYFGETYTFYSKEYKQESVNLSRQFFSFLRSIPRFNAWFRKKTALKEWEWLITNEIDPEFFGILLLESIAKKMAIDPAYLYTVRELSQLVVTTFHEKEVEDKSELNETMMYSLREWLTKYVKQKSPISDIQLVASFYHYFKIEDEDNREVYDLLMGVSWKSGLESLFLIFLEERYE